MVRSRQARRRTMRRRAWSALPAWLLAVTGIVGFLFTLRPATTTPPLHEPIRFPSTAPLTTRLFVILAPQLDARGLTTLHAALGPPFATPGAIVTIARPGFATFDEATLQLFAGNVAGGSVPPVAADTAGQVPDTVVRSVAGQGRGVVLLGSADWQALFGVTAPAVAVPLPPLPPAVVPAVTPLSSAALLAAAGSALRTRQAALVLLQMRDLTARDLRPGAGTLAGSLADLGALLDANDSLLIVGGGGGTGESLRLVLSGAGIGVSQTRSLALNDFAPTAAVLLGAPYPVEARGRIAWSLLAADTRQKAEATTGLARQRAGLVVSTLPLGRPYPPELLALQVQFPTLDAALAEGQDAYAYQLASSVVDQSDRLLLTAADVTPLPVSPRAAPWLLAAYVGVTLYALLIAILARAWLPLGAAAIGLASALALWLVIDVYLPGLIAPHLAVVIALTMLLAIGGGGVCAWLMGLLRDYAEGVTAPMVWRAVELLVLLAALPAAICAFRYGLPWRLRLEETAPLFRWRAALLAPVAFLLAGAAWTLLLARLGGRRRGGAVG